MSSTRDSPTDGRLRPEPSPSPTARRRAQPWRPTRQAGRFPNDGFVTGLTRPLNDVGVLDAWATDVTLRPDGQPLMSVAIREDPDPFDPIPP